MNEFTIYSKDACSFCDRAKALLEASGRSYTELKLGRDIEMDSLLEAIQHFGHGRTMPMVILNDDGHGNTERVGGYEELRKFLQGDK
jgi:glutaredoxin 3